MKTLELLRLLSDGKPKTSAQIKKATGLTMREVQNTIRALRRGEYLRAQPVLFVATAKGMKRSHAQTREEKGAEQLRKERNLRLAAKRAQDAARLMLQVEDEPDDMPAASASDIQRSALSKRPALEKAWGSAPREVAV